MIKPSAQLERQLQEINRRSYPAYKSLRGSYDFQYYVLSIDHVQGDPFAAPSALHVTVPASRAAFPAEYYATDWRRVALQDQLLRGFARELGRYQFQAKGSGKSGLIAVSRCGQEVLERTACRVSNGEVTLRFEAGFPADGRTINSGELRKILFEYVPACVQKALLYRNVNQKRLREAIELAEDQHAVREELTKRHLAAFVANGSVLPRQSGVSERPMEDAVPFVSPASLEVELALPYRGKVRGMGIPQGITLIVGGGYHGKSTLLKALERGIYNHIGGDGRELVITDGTAVKIRAEDGRSIAHVNISPFISNLPNGRDTVDFSTEDASGSTSQAANVAEAIMAGSRLLLIDEDTCATNFMVRDELMQRVIAREKEPIIPFVERVRPLWERDGISTILVAGSSGSYFAAADLVLQMDAYRAYDITEQVRRVLSEWMGADGATPQGDVQKKVPNVDQNADVIPVAIRGCPQEESVAARINAAGGRKLASRRLETRRDQVKIKQYGRDSFSIGDQQVDLKLVEQLVDREQTAALARILRHILEQTERDPADIGRLIEAVDRQIASRGLASLADENGAVPGLAQVRTQDIYACLNRFRGWK